MTEDMKKSLAPIMKTCSGILTKAAYVKLVASQAPDAEIVSQHNNMCFNVDARVGMLMNQMSAVKGTPTSAKVAIWRYELASIQTDLKTMEVKL